MEWFYDEALNLETKCLTISGEEFKHIKAHRLNTNSKIVITNGKGLACEFEISEFTKSNCTVVVSKFLETKQHNKRIISLAMPLLDSKERFEFAFEKSIELGATNFIPLITEYSSKKAVNLNRLKAKAISSIKQCQRDALPNISSAERITDVINSSASSQKIIVADIFGYKPKLDEQVDNILLIVGPEGGLSEQEIALLHTKTNVSFWNLGQFRLRAETSAIVLLSVLMQLINYSEQDK